VLFRWFVGYFCKDNRLDLCLDKILLCVNTVIIQLKCLCFNKETLSALQRNSIAYYSDWLRSHAYQKGLDFLLIVI
jgi:hypothetical protein